MELKENQSNVYVKVDKQGRITACDGGLTTPKDLTQWQKIDTGTGDRYNLCQSHYFAGGLYTEDGLCRWKYEGGVCVVRSDAELAADRATHALPPIAPTNTELMTAILELSELVAGGEA